MLIHLVCAARPNFMKIAPLYHALKRELWANAVIVHTGQHYDLNMSDSFFIDLRLPKPDISLGVGSGTHAEQTGKVLIAYEKVLLETRPDLVVVVGDVNSTVACALAASKVSYPLPHSPHQLSQPCAVHRAPCAVTQPNKPALRRPLVAHLEAGLRSFDRTMPEEINRLLTDAIADILWTPSADGDENLLREGLAPDKIQRVGNIMIDSLEMLRGTIERQTAFSDLNLSPKEYGVVTLHRPSNVDSPETMKRLCGDLKKISGTIPLVLPVHPRTKKNMVEFGLYESLSRSKGLILLEPLNYVRFMNLVFNCRLVITDSGGVQEETSYLGIPCLTLRENTERPITVAQGTNQLCSLDDLRKKTDEALKNSSCVKKKIDLWDGKTADRILEILANLSTHNFASVC